MNNLLIREWLNGALIPLNFCVIVMITRTLYVARRDSGRGWTREPGIASACAFWWIFLADMMRSGMAWYVLNAQNNGLSMQHLSGTTTIVYIVAIGIMAVAIMRLIYTLGADHWRHKGWLAAALLTVAFVGALEIIQR